MFRAEDTIAYLGAENPSSSTNGDIADQNLREEEKEEEKEKRKKKKKEEKERDREERRAKEKEEKESRKETKKEEREAKRSAGNGIIGRVISQPQGDLRHTCHVGADGRSFGLLNVRYRIVRDKGHLEST